MSIPNVASDVSLSSFTEVFPEEKLIKIIQHVDALFNISIRYSITRFDDLVTVSLKVYGNAAVARAVKMYLPVCLKPEYKALLPLDRSFFDLLQANDQFWCRVVGRHYLVRLSLLPATFECAVEGTQAVCEQVSTDLSVVNRAFQWCVEDWSAYDPVSDLEWNAFAELASVCDLCEQLSVPIKRLLLPWMKWHQDDRMRYAPSSECRKLRLTFQSECDPSVEATADVTSSDETSSDDQESVSSPFVASVTANGDLSTKARPDVTDDAKPGLLSDYRPSVDPAVTRSASCPSCEEDREQGQGTGVGKNGREHVSRRRLRPIVIDGNNVAMNLGKHRNYEAIGIVSCLNYFLKRGHDVLTFVPCNLLCPRSRLSQDSKNILNWMGENNLLSLTPSRTVLYNGCDRKVTCYDDLYIVKCAFDSGGTIVSNDRFRDVAVQCPEWQDIICNRVLMYAFVNNQFYPALDSRGRDSGICLDDYYYFNDDEQISSSLIMQLDDEQRKKLLSESNDILAGRIPPARPYHRTASFALQSDYNSYYCTAVIRSDPTHLFRSQEDRSVCLILERRDFGGSYSGSCNRIDASKGCNSAVSAGKSLDGGDGSGERAAGQTSAVAVPDSLSGHRDGDNRTRSVPADSADGHPVDRTTTNAVPPSPFPGQEAAVCETTQLSLPANQGAFSILYEVFPRHLVDRALEERWGSDVDQLANRLLHQLAVPQHQSGGSLVLQQ